MFHQYAAFVVLSAVLTGGCAVGLDRNPLTPEQLATLKSRPVPAQTRAADGMVAVMVRVPISAPPTEVWNRLAVQYGDVHQWSGTVEESEFREGASKGEQGAVRSCKLGDNSPIGKGEVFEETIFEWDPERRYFAAGVDDGFYPMKRAVQEFWVEAAGSGSVVVTLFHFDLSFPMGKGNALLGKIKPQVVTSLLGLKHLIETGNSAQAQDSDYLRSAYPEVYTTNGTKA